MPAQINVSRLEKQSEKQVSGKRKMIWEELLRVLCAVQSKMEISRSSKAEPQNYTLYTVHPNVGMEEDPSEKQELHRFQKGDFKSAVVCSKYRILKTVRGISHYL